MENKIYREDSDFAQKVRQLEDFMHDKNLTIYVSVQGLIITDGTYSAVYMDSEDAYNDRLQGLQEFPNGFETKLVLIAT